MKAVACLCFFLAVLEFPSGLSKIVQCSYPFTDIGNNCYYISPSGIIGNWIQAKEQCVNIGGRLAILDTKEKNKAVLEYIEQHPDIHPEAVWFGLTDKSQEGTYIWDGTGLPTTYTKFKTLVNPFSKKPETEDCIALAEGSWEDYPCGYSFQYICEERPKPNCSAPYIALKTGCYNFVVERLNFAGAHNYCNKLNSSLVTIGCEQENKALQDFIFRNYSGHLFWTGAYDEGHESKWYWEYTSSPIEYANWIEGHPPIKDTERNCAVIGGTGWIQQKCEKTYSFVCEKD